MKIELGIRIGRERIALLMPALGIVVKLPRIKIWKVIREAASMIRKRKWNRLWTHLKNNPTSEIFSFWNMLFGGIAANFSEFWFYASTWHRFVRPTYFSLFGLFNIQSYGASLKMGEGEFLAALERIIEENWMHDIHHFANPANFGLRQGTAYDDDGEKRRRLRLCIADYGSPRTQAVITLFGRDLFKSFTPPE